MNPLPKRKKLKIGYLILTIFFFGLFLSFAYLGQIIFINRTESMSRGIYLKQVHKKLNLGNIIVFYSDTFKGNLIKYIAAIKSDEVCINHENVVWVNSFSVAQKNIQKYPAAISDQSLCQTLKTDELFVLGEHSDSYDSRYFGPIKTTDVIAQVKLLWSF